MPIYASMWKGAGTNNNPRVPTTIADPARDTWRGVAMFKDMCFINYAGGPVADPLAPPPRYIVIAPDLDTPIGTTNAQALRKPPFDFPCTATETPRDIAHRLGVWFEGEVRP